MLKTVVLLHILMNRKVQKNSKEPSHDHQSDYFHLDWISTSISTFSFRKIMHEDPEPCCDFRL